MIQTVITPANVANRQKLDIRPGRTVRVWSKIEEKGKTRLQAFEGMVIARKHGNEPGATFTVRRSTGGVGVERIFPLYSPNIDKIEIVKASKVRRSKLYYIRDKAARELRRRLKRLTGMVFDNTQTEAEKPEPVESDKAEIVDEEIKDETEEAEIPNKEAEEPEKIEAEK
ncbi:MAG: 50S ribosomal protein L19 [Patescibacteria group bacterium]